jgi:hypothetical protein
MSDRIGTPEPTVEDELAKRVRARRGPAAWWAPALREMGSIDRAVYDAVADTPSVHLDGAVRRLSTAADRSRLWIVIAAVVAVLGGDRGRRAAVDGLASIASTSAAVTLASSPSPGGAGPGGARSLRLVTCRRVCGDPRGAAARRADPSARRSRGLLTSSYGCALPERRGDRFDHRIWDSRNGDRVMRCLERQRSDSCAVRLRRMGNGSLTGAEPVRAGTHLPVTQRCRDIGKWRCQVIGWRAAEGETPG